MATIGFFRDATEMLKLVQSTLLAGVVQEIYEEGQLLGKLPITQIDSYKLLWNREKSLPTITPKSLGEQYSWKSVADFTRVELELEEYGDQWKLDRFIQDTYKNPNDYRAVVMKMIVKGCLRTIENDLIYGDHASNPKEMDGIDKLCPALSTGDNFRTSDATHNPQAFYAGGNGARTSILRDLIDRVKPKPNILLMSRTSRNVLSAAAFEVGINSNAIGRITYNNDQFGTRIDYFDGIQIMVSDYLVQENVTTGGKDSGGTTQLVSIYAIRFGEVEDGGLSLALGGGTGGANFFNEVPFDKLEFENAEGIRMYAFCALAMGGTKSVARYHDIDWDEAVKA